MRKSVSQCRPENFYLHGYGRSQGMVNHVTNLTDAVALLTQATEPLIHGKKLIWLLFNGETSATYNFKNSYQEIFQ